MIHPGTIDIAVLVEEPLAIRVLPSRKFRMYHHDVSEHIMAMGRITMKTQESTVGIKDSEFISEGTAGFIVETTAGMRPSPRATEVDALTALRADVYQWTGRSAGRETNPHREHAAHIIGAHLAERAAALFIEDVKEGAPPLGPKRMEIMEDPKAFERSNGRSEPEGVPMPPAILGSMNREATLALVGEALGHIAKGPEGDRDGISGILDTTRSLMDLSKDLPPREQRTDRQRILGEAVEFMSNEMTFDALEWSKIGLMPRTDEQSLAIRSRVDQVLYRVSQDSQRLWGVKGVDAASNGASNPRPYDYQPDGERLAQSKANNLTSAIVKGRSEGRSVTDVMSAFSAKENGR